MIRCRIIRQPTSDEGTFGLWTIPERALSWPSLELPARGNASRKSCIDPMPGEPSRVYVASLRHVSKWSPRTDGRLFGLLDVPGRTDIEIHAATWAGDVDLGWHTDLLGCITVGSKVGTLVHPEVGREQAAILGSRAALTELMAELGDEDFELEVLWAG